MIATPLDLSPTPEDTDISAAEVGIEMLGLTLLPQGEEVARLLEAKGDDGRPMYRRIGVQIPRRSTKTTSIWATILGRCMTIPKYRVVVTAQDGSRASLAIREVMYALDEDSPDYTLRWSNGGEAIHFSNGSRIERRPPKASTFRGAAADLLWFDEAGEYDAATSNELVQGALPLMDTRPMGQVVISGTPAKVRAGLLWDTLQAGKDPAHPRVGCINYAATDEDNPEDEDLWWLVHPGLASGLTEIDIIRERFATMPLPAFMMEYLGVWPLGSQGGAIDFEKWRACGGDTSPKPTRFTLAFDVAPDASSAAIVAAWRSSDGLAHVDLVDHRLGTSWLPKAVYDLVVKYRVDCWYDAIGQNIESAEVLGREVKAAGRIKPVPKKEVGAGQSSFVRLVHDGKLSHPDDVGLDDAVKGAAWRETPESGRYFGWKASASDISPLRAAAEALWANDQNPPKAPLKGAMVR